MKTEPRYPKFVGLKLSAELEAAIRRAAREDDRTVSGYLRRLITATVRRPDEDKRESEQR